MIARCAKCGLRFSVPDDRAAKPGLTVQCKCGAQFPLRTAGHATGSAAAEGAAPAAGRAPAAPASGQWRRCSNHPQVKSASVCPNCAVGFCPDCEKRVQNVPVCPRCEGLCTEAALFEEIQQRDKQRARTMKDDVGFIFAYPFTDPWAYGMLAVFTWFFGYFYALLSQGVLIWYSFSAVSRVSAGRMKGYMPEFNDIGDVANAARLAFAAFLASTWPLIVVGYFAPYATLFSDARSSLSVVHGQDAEQGAGEEQLADEEGGEINEGAGGAAGAAAPRQEVEDFDAKPTGTDMLWKGLLVLALLWQLLYTPMALIVAAISRGFLSTLNPIVGVHAILKMGSAYWIAAALYTVLIFIQGGLDRVLGLVPIAGSFVGSFIHAYVYLTTGCALGLGVFKKARELGLD